MPRADCPPPPPNRLRFPFDDYPAMPACTASANRDNTGHVARQHSPIPRRQVWMPHTGEQVHANRNVPCPYDARAIWRGALIMSQEMRPPPFLPLDAESD